MRMFPAQLYDTKSNAECKVFKKLQKINFLGKDAVVFHSLNIPKHINQRTGEADFVLLCKRGLFIFEIKGGKIWRNTNGWTFTDRNGRNFFKKKGPFRQAEDAMHSIVNRVKNKFEKEFTKKLIYGFGVIVPDCNLPDSEEWCSEILLNSNNFGLFDQWLEKFINYWRVKTPWGQFLEMVEVEVISEYLRPNFETAISLHSQIENTEEQICKFTNDQFSFLDIMEENSRIICSGGAGTGKTFLAAELCRRLSYENKVLLVCKSKILAAYLNSKFKSIHNTVISTIEALPVIVSRNKIEKFHVLIIDEGQDLCNFTDLTVIEQYIHGGWQNGVWYFFHDINNQSGILGRYEAEAMEYLKSFAPVSIPLRKNCRNTRPIMNKIQDLTDLDMGNSGNGIGPEVEIINTSEDVQADVLCNELEKLKDANISFKDITILSTKSFSDSCIYKLKKNSRKRIRVINDFNVASSDNNKIQFSKITDFKGLENQCVILIDINKSIDNYISLLYVGMSRARVKLTVIFT